ncbi:MAG: mono/diheme cytochrome c family protein [Pirellulaceae bacterium]|jgi:mono/diheme cytochrome c family protein
MRTSVRRSNLLAVLFACALTSLAATSTTAAERNSLPHYVDAFLERYCIQCHGPSRQEAEFRVDVLAQTGVRASEYQHWIGIRDRLVRGDMPPANEPRPAARVFSDVAGWISSELSSLAPRSDANVRQIVVRRLNRDQYNNTVRDLLGTDIQPADNFPADTPAFGFSNNGGALNVTPLHFENYLAAASRLIDRVVQTQPNPVERNFRFEAEHPGRIQFQHDRSRLMGNVTLRGKAQENNAVLFADRKYGDALIINHIPLTKPGRYLIRIRLSAQHVPNHGPPRLRLTAEKRVVLERDVTDSDFHILEEEVHLPAGDIEVRLVNSYQVPMTIDNMRARSRRELEQPQLTVDYVEVHGPTYTQWPPLSHQRICFPSRNGANEKIYSREVISKFMSRAFRRPVNRSEVERFAKLYDQVRPHKSIFYEAIKMPLVAILASPDFLYLVENQQPVAPVSALAAGSAISHKHRVSGYEIANRLSYFLWNTMPDNQLFQQAQDGELHSPTELKVTVDRMLRDEKRLQFSRSFASQWLGTESLGQVPPDTRRYPHYDPHLEQSMMRQTEALFNEVLEKDLSVMKLLDSDFVMLNERLARFYEIDGVTGDQFRAVPVSPQSHRGGVLTHGSILTLTSNGTRTSPVKRGAWILERLLDSPPPPPPENAGDLDTDVPAIGKVTVKQRLAKHREVASCASCHAGIDPLGFALENYNAVGQWRTREREGYHVRSSPQDPLIDPSGTLPNGRTIAGVDQLREYLVGEEDRFTMTIVRRMLTYALGRGLSSQDDVFVNQLHRDFRQSGDRLVPLIHAITQSELFQTK